MARIAGVGFDLEQPGQGLYPGYGSGQPYIGQALLNPMGKKKDDDTNPWDLINKSSNSSASPDSAGGGESNALKDTLDIATLIPGVGSFASGANALMSASQGDFVGATQSAAMAIPGIGTAMKGLQLGSKFGKLGQKFGRIGGMFKGTGA